MSYPTYLVHFNRNHDSKNGQFTYGDGDGDGKINDTEYDKLSRRQKKQYVKYRQKRQNEIQNYHTHRNDDNADKLYKKYMEAYDKFYNNSELDYDKNPKEYYKLMEQFERYEKEWLMYEGEQEAKQLIEKFGAKDVSELSFGFVSPFLSAKGKSTVTMKYDDVDDLIKQYAKEFYYAHRD